MSSESRTIHYMDFKTAERISNWLSVNPDKQVISIETVRLVVAGYTQESNDTFRVWYYLQPTN